MAYFVLVISWFCFVLVPLFDVIFVFSLEIVHDFVLVKLDFVKTIIGFLGVFQLATAKTFFARYGTGSHPKGMLPGCLNCLSFDCFC